MWCSLIVWVGLLKVLLFMGCRDSLWENTEELSISRVLCVCSSVFCHTVFLLPLLALFFLQKLLQVPKLFHCQCFLLRSFVTSMSRMQGGIPCQDIHPLFCLLF